MNLMAGLILANKAYSCRGLIARSLGRDFLLSTRALLDRCDQHPPSGKNCAHGYQRGKHVREKWNLVRG